MIQKFSQQLFFTFFLVIVGTFAYPQEISTELGNYDLQIPYPKNVNIQIPKPFELESQQIPPFEQYQHPVPKDWSFPSFWVDAKDYFFEGVKRYEARDFEGSVAQFEKAILESEDDPRIVQASLYWIGRTWLEQKQLTRARNYFKQAVGQNMETDYAARSAYALVWILVKRRKLNLATQSIEDYQKHFKKPEFIESILYLKAYTYMSQKNYEQTLQVFASIQRQFPRSPHIVSIIGWIAEISFLKRDKQIVVRLVQDYQHTLYNYPEMEKVFVVQFWLELLDKNWKTATRHFQMLQQRGLNNPLLLIQAEFYLALIQNQIQQAHQLLKQLPPETSGTETINLAKAAFLQKNFSFLAQFDPPILPQYFFLSEHYLLQGIAYEELNKQRLAFDLYNMAIGSSNQKSIAGAALFNQAALRLKQKKIKEASQFLQRLVADFSELEQSSEFFFWLGVTHYQLHQKLYRLAFHQVSPSSERGDDKQFFLGQFYLSQYRFSNAHRSFQNLIKRYPDSRYIDESYYRLAQIAFVQRDYMTSKKLFEKWHQDYPQNPVSNYHLELWMQSSMALKDWDNALSLIEQFGHRKQYPVMRMQLDALEQKKQLETLISTSSQMLKVRLTPRQKEWILMKRASTALTLQNKQDALKYYENALNYAVAENRRICYYHIASLANQLQLKSKFIQHAESFESIQIYDEQYLEILLLMTSHYNPKKEAKKLQRTRNNLIQAYQFFLKSPKISKQKRVALNIQLAHEQTAMRQFKQSQKSLQTALQTLDTEPPLVFFREKGSQAFQSKEYETAIASYLRLIYLNPKMPQPEKKKIFEKIKFAYQQLKKPKEQEAIEKLTHSLNQK